jgi:CO/xanthine dehydrogenase FAD-binding subunit
MKPPIFEYSAPGTVAEAIALLQADPGAMVLAGGQSLVPAMNFRLANPTRLVDIQRIPDLSGINLKGNTLVVGAMVRHRDLELSEIAYRANPLIGEALAHVAHIPIRNRGTVVGSLCHADAAAELPMVLVLTGGSVLAVGASGTREIAAENFFQFHMTTSRQQDEVVTEARFPVLPQGAGYAFEEFTRRHGDYAIAGVGAIVQKDASGAAHVSLAACGVSSRPIRLKAAEAVLEGRAVTAAQMEVAGEAAKEVVTAPDDMHATGEYRRHVLATLVRRALARASARTR